MLTILLVEDDEDIADFLQEFLREIGYDVMLVRNGQQALDALTLVRPSVILSDIMMPVMSGLDLCRRLSQHDHYRAIPLILTSAGIRPQELNGFPHTTFIPKPFQLPELQAVLEHIVENI